MATASPTPVDDDIRRREFGDFLRSRREALTPAQVGLPAGFRRRTPGLRREEVAMLAGVGATWYTWLEQGRDVQASTEVLSGLADALRLDPAERRHLFALSDKPLPRIASDGPEQVPAALQRMLDSLTGQPAQVLGRRWDILAWNRAAQVLFCDYARLQGDERNAMHLAFADPRHRRMLVDWDALAPVWLAMFRADSARHAGDPDFERLIAKLKAASPEFRAGWARHEVLRQPSSQKRIRHPVAGRMTFEFCNFAMLDQGDLKLVVYTPLVEDGSAARLEALLRRKPAAKVGVLAVKTMRKEVAALRAGAG